MLTLYEQTRRMKPVAVLVAAHPIWNVPPFVNAARELARHGYSVLLLGYHADHLPRYERIESGAWILRLRLRSRRIRGAGPRRMLALCEFLYLARATIRRLHPNVLITFNDPACILQRVTRSEGHRRRVNWLLEYPEFERLGFCTRRLFRFSASCWKDADTLVAPTGERLALHLSLQPECAGRRTFVVQNAPCKTSTASSRCSQATAEAIRFLNEAPSGVLRIVYSGAIGNRYGIDRIIRAAGSFPAEVRLLLLGKKHLLARQEVEAALTQTGAPPHIQWIDEVPYPELSEVLRTADVGFATYIGDTLNTRFAAPGKLYEYLKNGLVILTDRSSCLCSETAAAGCGVFFPHPATDKGIQGAIRQLVDRRDEIPKMKEASRRLFETWLCMEKQIAPLLDDLSIRIREGGVPTSQGIAGATLPLPSR